MISVDLKHLLEDEIKGVAPDMESTVNLRGPSTLLYAELSRSFSMLIHELATNAVKYGCFSAANGALDVKWDVKDETLHLSWSWIWVKDDKNAAQYRLPNAVSPRRVISHNNAAAFGGLRPLRRHDAPLTQIFSAAHFYQAARCSLKFKDAIAF